MNKDKIKSRLRQIRHPFGDCRQLLRGIANRIEGFIIGALIVGVLAYASGLQRGERSAADCWAALDAEGRYQAMGDAEFDKFERGLSK